MGKTADDGRGHPIRAMTLEHVTPSYPVGSKPRKPCGPVLSAARCGAVETPNGRLAIARTTHLARRKA